MRDPKNSSARHDYMSKLCREFIRNNAPAVWEGLVNTVNLKYPSEPKGRPLGQCDGTCRKRHRKCSCGTGNVVVFKGVDSGVDE